MSRDGRAHRSRRSTINAMVTDDRDGLSVRVVSMPCREWFTAQPLSYQDSVLPPAVRVRVSVEAATGQGWRDVVGDTPGAS
jgi:transketolase